MFPARRQDGLSELAAKSWSAPYFHVKKTESTFFSLDLLKTGINHNLNEKIMYQPSAFDSIKKMVSGKNVSLLGSAPGDYRSEMFPDDQPLVCINGAALGIHNLKKRKPEITIINTAVANSPNAGKPTRELLSNISTKLLVIVESGFPLDKSEKIFEPITRDTTEIITLDERCTFLEKFLGKPLTGRAGGQHVPSTGFFSCLALIACGAKKIIPSGLSFIDGHSYINQKYKREHIMRDCEVLNWIKYNSLPVEFNQELISSAQAILAKGIT